MEKLLLSLGNGKEGIGRTSIPKHSTSLPDYTYLIFCCHPPWSPLKGGKPSPAKSKAILLPQSPTKRLLLSLGKEKERLGPNHPRSHQFFPFIPCSKLPGTNSPHEVFKKNVDSFGVFKQGSVFKCLAVTNTYFVRHRLTVF